MISGSNGLFKVMSLNDFMRNFDNPQSDIHKWGKVLDEELKKVYDKDVRQRILRYGIIIAMLIDFFDPKHKIVLERKIYTNKLNVHSMQVLKHELLPHYLPFVKNREKYYQKKMRPAGHKSHKKM